LKAKEELAAAEKELEELQPYEPPGPELVGLLLVVTSFVLHIWIQLLSCPDYVLIVAQFFIVVVTTSQKCRKMLHT
jgi:hypothetical protein